MTKILRMGDMVEVACKNAKKWGLYLEFTQRSTEGDWKEKITVDKERVKKSLRHPKLKKDKEIFWALITEGWAFLLLDTEEETYQLYKGVDGDDTQGFVYAMTCTPTGQIKNENT